jgi:restriction system protein
MVSKRSSVAQDLIEIVAVFPAWVGVVLALLAFPLLHWLAIPSPVIPVQPAQMADVVLRSMGHAFANIGQYLLPLIFLTGAGVSFWRRRNRQALFATVAQSHGTTALDALSWREFERLVGEAFRRDGFQVVETGGGGADGGIDLVLTKGSEKTLVQCKQWKARSVGVSIVRELYGLMAAKGAAAGYVVTSGSFTEDASAFAEGRNIALINGERLLDLIATGQQVSGSASQRASSRSIGPQASQCLPCPVCGLAMIKRIARKGGKIGTEFWGCSSYPKCRGTRRA